MFELSGQMFFDYNIDQFVKYMSSLLGFKASEDSARKSLSEDVKAVQKMKAILGRRRKLHQSIEQCANSQEISKAIDSVQHHAKRIASIYAEAETIVDQACHSEIREPNRSQLKQRLYSQIELLYLLAERTYGLLDPISQAWG